MGIIWNIYGSKSSLFIPKSVIELSPILTTAQPSSFSVALLIISDAEELIALLISNLSLSTAALFPLSLLLVPEGSDTKDERKSLPKLWLNLYLSKTYPPTELFASPPFNISSPNPPSNISLPSSNLPKGSVLPLILSFPSVPISKSFSDVPLIIFVTLGTIKK